MRYAKFMKFSKLLPTDKVVEIFMSKTPLHHSVYDKGTLLRPFDPKTLRFGYDGDDFARNLITVVMDRKGYKKVPSILKLIYKVEKYRPKRYHRSRRQR